MKLCKILFISLLLVVFNLGSTAMAAKKFTLVAIGAKGWSYAADTDRFVERVNKSLEGKIEIVTNNSLFKANQYSQAVRDGMVHMATVIPAYSSATYPVIGVGTLPGIYNNFEEYKMFFNGFFKEAVNKVYSEKFNATVLAYGTFCPQAIFTTKPIKSIADFKGKLIRTSNIEFATMLSALGAKATATPPGEVFPSLQRGIIDGTQTDLCFAMVTKTTTVAKHCSLWPMASYAPFAIIINTAALNKLPADVKDALIKVGQEIEKEAFDMFEEYTKNRLVDVKTTLDSFADMAIDPSIVKQLYDDPNKYLKPVYESYYKRSGRGGFDGRSYVENAYKAVNKKLNF